MPGPFPSLESFVSRLPKVELHVHLEGSLRPETLEEIAWTKRGLRRKVGNWVGARRRDSYHYGDFRTFLRAFGTVTLLLEKPANYALATTRLIEWLAAQNVRYAEIIFSAGVVLWKRQSVQAVFEAVLEAADEAQKRRGVGVNWIMDAVRHFGVDHVRRVLRWAGRYRERGVVAFGIGGDESRGPAELFLDVFREARDLGLHLTAHAGETAGPESIRAAVQLLGAERIGHGLTAARAPEVVALLRERRVPLEVCLSSNVSTGLVKRVDDHPLPKFLAEGLLVTLNSDDPAMFGTSLEQEFRLAARAFGLNRHQIVGLCENAIRAAFLGRQEKKGLLNELRQAASRA